MRARGFDSSGYAGRLNQRRVEFQEQILRTPGLHPLIQTFSRQGRRLLALTLLSILVSGYNPLRTRQKKTSS
jgi:hypothetical protein